MRSETAVRRHAGATASERTTDERDGRKQSFLRLWKHLGSGLSSLAALARQHQGRGGYKPREGPTGSHTTSGELTGVSRGLRASRNTEGTCPASARMTRQRWP
jgi:hypothetical protein